MFLGYAYSCIPKMAGGVCLSHTWLLTGLHTMAHHQAIDFNIHRLILAGPMVPAEWN